jgi:hypothetical protein
MNTKSKVTIIPDATRGNTTRRMVARRLAPIRRAARSSSRGTSSMKASIIQIT